MFTELKYIQIVVGPMYLLFLSLPPQHVLFAHGAWNLQYNISIYFCLILVGDQFEILSDTWNTVFAPIMKRYNLVVSWSKGITVSSRRATIWWSCWKSDTMTKWRIYDVVINTLWRHITEILANMISQVSRSRNKRIIFWYESPRP